MSTSSTQCSFSVTSVKIILATPSRIRQRVLSLTLNIYIRLNNLKLASGVRNSVRLIHLLSFNPLYWRSKHEPQTTNADN